MKLLLDQGLPRSTVEILRRSNLEATHVGDIGMASAEDETILEHARDQGLVIVTLDADFNALLADSQAMRPSVIRIRTEGLRAPDLAALLGQVVRACLEDLRAGAMVSVTTRRIRLRRLPLLRP